MYFRINKSSFLIVVYKIQAVNLQTPIHIKKNEYINPSKGKKKKYITFISKIKFEPERGCNSTHNFFPELYGL